MKIVALLALLAGPVFAQAPTAPTPTTLGTVSGTAVDVSADQAADAAQIAQMNVVLNNVKAAAAAQAAIQANAPAQPPYVCHTAACFVWNDRAHAQVSAQLLYAPARKMAFDGGSADLAIIYNPAMLSSKWPAAWTAAGVPPPACAFLEMGGGGDQQSAFVHVGASCNVAPVVVGAAAKALTAAGGNYAIAGSLLLSPDGSGVKVSVGDKFNVVANGGVENLASIKDDVVIGAGYTYKFK